MAAQTKAPEAAVVAQDAGDDPTKREAAASEAQRQADAERGYTHEEWKPGVWHYRALDGHDTAFTETEIIGKVNEQRIAADRANRQG